MRGNLIRSAGAPSPFVCLAFKRLASILDGGNYCHSSLHLDYSTFRATEPTHTPLPHC
jgi:hypothetical protein